jgi:Na+-driven multidrug efflux pump
MAATGFFCSFIVGAIIAGTGTIFIKPLALLLGATDTILPYAVRYLRFILLGAPFIISSLMLNNLLRFQASAFFGMIGMVSGAVLNIILDPLFIFGLGMGVEGASLATMLSQFVSCVLLFVVGNKSGQSVRIRLKNFKPNVHSYKEMVRGGLPSLFRQGFMSIATLL